MRVLVISDTHDVLRPEVVGQIRLADAVIHAGDISSAKIVQRIRQEMADPDRLYMVRGNADREWAEQIPETLSFELGQVKFFAVHNQKNFPADLGDRQIIVFGHSHKYLAEERDGRLFLNPGSCGRRRFRMELSMAVLELDAGSRTVEKLTILPGEAQPVRAGSTQDNTAANREELSSGELLSLISGILARMKRGQTVAKIAADLELEPHFVEEICRICVTHPGVTANGILDKLEVNRRISK